MNIPTIAESRSILGAFYKSGHVAQLGERWIDF